MDLGFPSTVFLKWYGKWKGRVTAHEVIRRKCHLNALRAGIFA